MIWDCVWIAMYVQSGGAHSVLFYCYEIICVLELHIKLHYFAPWFITLTRRRRLH